MTDNVWDGWDCSDQYRASSSPPEGASYRQIPRSHDPACWSHDCPCWSHDEPCCEVTWSGLTPTDIWWCGWQSEELWKQVCITWASLFNQSIIWSQKFLVVLVTPANRPKQASLQAKIAKDIGVLPHKKSSVLSVCRGDEHYQNLRLLLKMGNRLYKIFLILSYIPYNSTEKWWNYTWY